MTNADASLVGTPERRGRGVMNDANYFDYLKTRSRWAWWYRRYYLYPRLGRYLSGRVLDVGCGIGDMLRYWPGATGVDINSQTVQFCCDQGFDVRLMAPDVLPFAPAAFASVVLDNVLEHLPAPQPLLREIHRVLVPGGRLLVGVPGRRGYATDPDHKNFYDEAGLVMCLAAADFGCQRLLHVPMKSRRLDATLRQYCIYGVFERTAG